MKNLDRSFFRFVRDHACDRRTDRRTDGQTDRILLAIPRLQYMQRGKNEVYKKVIGDIVAHLNRKNHLMKRWIFAVLDVQLRRL